jgi:hypothetical protein
MFFFFPPPPSTAGTALRQRAKRAQTPNGVHAVLGDSPVNKKGKKQICTPRYFFIFIIDVLVYKILHVYSAPQVNYFIQIALLLKSNQATFEEIQMQLREVGANEAHLPDGCIYTVLI